MDITFQMQLSLPLIVITLQDEVIQKKYVLFDRLKSNTLFYSLGYDKSSIDDIKEAIKMILSNAYRLFENDSIITVNVRNSFFISLDNSDSSVLDRTFEKLFWKENLDSENNAIENWMLRWISLIVIQLLECEDKIKQNIDKDKVVRLIGLTSPSTSYHLKLLSFHDLSFVDLRGADLTEADLRGANLNTSDLRRANLTKANLGTNSNLIRADPRRANLTKSNLAGANLEDADLSRANLMRANFRRANLARANLEDADLWGA